MTAIEQLIRTKLKDKLAEEKRRIASELIAEATPATTGQKKQNKQQQIAKLQARLTAMQGKVSKAKDPQAMQAALGVVKDKLALMKAEMGTMK